MLNKRIERNERMNVIVNHCENNNEFIKEKLNFG